MSSATAAASVAAVRNPAHYFVRLDVKGVLTKLTGFNLNRVFPSRFNPRLNASKLKLLTNEQLAQENEATRIRANRWLQMPPFLLPRDRGDVILAKDERLNPLNLNKTNYLFIDISMNVKHKNRNVTVRQHDGVLRTATHAEREKMLQVYYPTPGKSQHVPRMFEPEHLEECLKLKHYTLVLDKACVRFEPDDPEFIRVTHRVYEYVDQTRDYYMLRHTRFYGPLVFYLAWYNKLGNLIAYELEKDNVDNCVQLISLDAILLDAKPPYVHAKTKSGKVEKFDYENIIANFIRTRMKGQATLELAFNEFLKRSKQASKTVN